MSDVATLSEIWTYPVKSLKGISLNTAKIEMRGVQYDRRWMIVDSENNFISQRQYASLATIDVSMTGKDIVIISHAMGSSINLPADGITGEELKVKIWSDTCTAIWQDAEADAWISDYLKTKCKFVYMPDATFRQVDTRYVQKGVGTYFSDEFPFLLTNTRSLDDLSVRAGEVLTMKRFRPNLVINSAEPYEEDDWRRINIGVLEFCIAKLCARCVVTTIDPDSGDKGKEPLAALAQYRKKNKKLYFGQNMVVMDSGILSVGDKVVVVERKNN